MSTWPTDAVYIAKFNPNTGYFNDFFDRNDDLLRLAAIQIAEPGANDPNRDYLAFVEGTSGNKNIVLKIYQTGAIELQDGNVFKSMVLSDGDFSNLSETQLLSAKAVLRLVTDSLSDNDILDEAARTAVSNALTNVTDALDTRLDQEIARATTAESLLQGEVDQVESDLQSEEARALAAEAVLQTSIAAETTRATAAETLLQNSIDQLDTDLTAEVTRATAAEAALQASIDAVPALIQTAVSDNDVLDAAARDAVRVALESTDTATQNALNTEISRATAAEQANSAAITTEVNRATAAEQANAAAIAAETQARTAALAGIDLSGIATNAAAIAAETEARTAALAGIDLSGIATNATAIADEVARATAAEQANTAAIAAEGVVRASAVFNEETRATAAEQANATAIQAEETRATAAEQANATAIQAEETRATAAESNLQSSIDANTALIQAIEGGADIAQVAVNTQSIATNAAAIQNEASAREASDLVLQADILALNDEFDTLVSSSIPASYLLKIDGNDVVISTDGVSTGSDDPDPNNLTAIQELYAQINNLITQALPGSSMFRPVGNDFVVSGFLQGHAGGSLIEFSTGDIILPTEPTGFPESSFRLSDDYTEIIFGE